MPEVLLLHGLSASPVSWWRVRSWFEEEGWSVEAAALLGHDGRPSAPRYRLEDYARDAQRHRAQTGTWDLVLGHSLGGTTATLAASLDPAWTRRLALLDPVWHVPPARATAIRADQLDELALTRDSVLAANPGMHPRDLEAKLAAIRAVDPVAVSGSFDDNPVWDVRSEAAGLKIPTLVLAADPAVFTLLDERDAEPVAAANPRVTVRRVPGAGHGVHRDRPDEVRRALLDWLALAPGDAAA